MVVNRNKSKRITTQFRQGNKIIENPTEIANNFNNFFINVGPALASKILSSHKNPNDYIKISILDSFVVQATCEEEIENILYRLKNSSVWWDAFLPQHIKAANQYIKWPLTYICNQSFKTGFFPHELKIANVIPNYKNSEEHFITSYRPVSVLPIFCNVLETLVYRRLITFINKRKLLYDSQFGFRENSSTVMALITIIDKITESLERGDYALVIFLDFSKHSTQLIIIFYWTNYITMG